MIAWLPTTPGNQQQPYWLIDYDQVIEKPFHATCIDMYMYWQLTRCNAVGY